MKVATSLLVAGFLLATVPVFGADSPAASPEITASPEIIASPEVTPSAQAQPSDEALSTPAEDCNDVGNALVSMSWQKPTPAATQYCGACSDPICRGVVRGSSCGGAKHCNIFSGGNWCPTGNWECQCQAGPLP